MQFYKSFEFEYGRCNQVSSLIQRVICNNPGPFTYTGTGTYIVGRSQQGAHVAVIDPGPLDTDHLDALLRALEGRTVSHILVTHTHLDHSPLSTKLAETCGNAPIFAATSPQLSSHAANINEADDVDFMPDVLLSDGDLIEGDGWTIEAITTPGHASNHIAFALQEENTLFSGDHIMGWSTTIVSPPDGDMADYINSLDKVMARDFDIIWPTHGPAITDVKPFLENYRAHRIARELQVIEQLTTGHHTIAQMVPILYASVDQKLWPAASLSILSHLIKLVKDGRVEASPSPELSARWRLV